MKFTLRILFSLFIAGSILLTIISICADEWITTAASLALIIAIISAWIAFETFRDNVEQKEPRLSIIPDVTSRYGLIQLRLRNHGQNPAYCIKINWNNFPLNHRNEKVTFNKYRCGEYEALILNGNEETSVLIDTHSGFFEKHKSDNLTFSGIITYLKKISSTKRISTPFKFSLEHYGSSLDYDVEELRTNVELQKIPKLLKAIKDEIGKLRNTN